MNPLYNQLMSQGAPQQKPVQHSVPGGPQFTNPMQKMNYIMQAMRNPAQFVKQRLPQIPAEAFNDPTGNTVLQYMMNNMGVTQQDIQNVISQNPRF